MKCLPALDKPIFKQSEKNQSSYNSKKIKAYLHGLVTWYLCCFVMFFDKVVYDKYERTSSKSV